jgi:hypothetical protein
MLCGWASIDEHGHARNGKAGDQTGREVKTGNWYDFGQNVIIRFKDREKAKKAAKICKAICNNKHVGYDQNQRTTLFDTLKKVDWDPSKLTKNVETDCSAMMAVCANAVGIKVSKNWYTGNMVEYAKDHPKEFKILRDKKYLNSPTYLKTGDMILNTRKHVIMALQDGSGKEDKITQVARDVIAGKYGNGKERKKKLAEAGYNYAIVQKKVNELLRG